MPPPPPRIPEPRPPEPPEGAGAPLEAGPELVRVPASGPRWRQWLAVAGPALLVSVGYMDPGNWATDLAGGSRYGYRLLWVLLLSNLMAILLQSLAARLGVVRRRDLAQASREAYPAAVNLALYLMAEVAIAACDLAEVLGSAIALNLLSGLPLLAGVAITTLDVLLLLSLTRLGIRKLEAVILSLVATIGTAFLVEVCLARPALGPLLRGFVPALPDAGALYLAIAISGAPTATCWPTSTCFFETMPSSGARNTVRSCINRAASKRALAAATSGFCSRLTPSIRTRLACLLPTAAARLA